MLILQLFSITSLNGDVLLQSHLQRNPPVNRVAGSVAASDLGIDGGRHCNDCQHEQGRKATDPCNQVHSISLLEATKMLVLTPVM